MTIANTTIVVKKSATPGNVPTTLANGELAINYADGKLYYKSASGAITSISSSGPTTNSFATINASGTLVLASSPTDILTIVGANGISIAACTTTKVITIDDSAAFNQANLAESLAQSAFNSSNAKFDTSGGTISGNVSIVGSLTVSGNVAITGNINQISGNSGQFFGNTTTGFNALYAGIPTGYVVEPDTSFQVSTNYNGYAQINQQNINTGNQATGDYVVTSGSGNNTQYYIDMGYASGTYDGTNPNNSLGTSLYPNDGYLYVQGNPGSFGGNLVIGTSVSGTVLKIIAGGINQSNIVTVFTGSSTNVLNNLVLTQYPITFADGSKQNTAAASYAFSNAAFNQANAAYAAANSVSSVNFANVATYSNIANTVQITTQSNGTYYLKLANTASGYANTSANIYLTYNATSGNLSAPHFVGDGSLLSNVASLTALNANTAGTANVALAINVTNQSTGTYYLKLSNTTSGTANTSANTLLTYNAASGNLAAPYFVGNGSLLTGVASNTSITALTSNIALAINVTTANTGTYYLKMGDHVSGSSNVYANTYLTYNAASEILTANYFSGNGIYLTGIAASTASSANTAGTANVALAINVTTANTGTYYLKLANTVSGISNTSANINLSYNAASGNLSAPYFIGNGSFLTGVVSNSALSAITSNVSEALIVTNANTGTYFIKMGDQSSGASNVYANTYLTYNAASETLTANYFSGNGIYLTGITASTATSANTANVANTLNITNPNTGIYFVKFGSSSNGQSQLSANSNFTFNANTDQLSVPQLAVAGVSSSTPPGGSLQFNGTNQYLTIPSNTGFAFGTGDFTVEMWIYWSGSYATTTRLFSCYTSGIVIYPNSSGNMTYGQYGIGTNITSSTTVPLNTWVHLAIARVSGVSTMYINGTAVGTKASDTSNFGQTGVYIGTDSGANLWTGNITNLRVVKGTAVYTSNFTPSTSPLPAVTNTQLLLDVSTPSTYISDSSVNNLTLTNHNGVTYSSNTALTTAYQNSSPSISTTTGALVVVGGVGVSGNVYANGLVVSNTTTNATSSKYIIQTSTAATTQNVIDTWPTNTYRSAKYMIQMTQGLNYHVIESLIVQNGSTAFMSQYNEVTTGVILGTFDASITSGTLSLLLTPSSANSMTINIVKDLISV